MAKFEKKNEACKLRRQGMSINAIARALGVAKSTVSIWCRDIPLTKQQRERLIRNKIDAGNYGRMLGAESNRKKKQENIALQEKIARESLGNLTDRDKMMLGIGLYWGEGAKSYNTAIVNSDPDLILFACEWFEQLGVERGSFNPYIFISETHRGREDEIRKFWSNYLSLPLEQFRKVVFLKGRPKKVYENHDSYYGILALRIRRGTTLRYRILGLIKACKRRGSSAG